jgi:AcrR family transcriptional regulator
MKNEPKLAGRPRDEKVRKTILRTALELAAKRGYAQVTLLDIANQAHVARTTIYRWWPSKSRLYLEAIFDQYDELLQAAPPEETSLQAHLMNLVTIVREKTGTITISLLLEAQHDQELRENLYERLRQRRLLFKTFIEREQQRKNKLSKISTDTMTDMLIGAVWYRLLYQFAPLDDAFVEELTAVIDEL